MSISSKKILNILKYFEHNCTTKRPGYTRTRYNYITVFFADNQINSSLHRNMISNIEVVIVVLENPCSLPEIIDGSRNQLSIWKSNFLFKIQSGLRWTGKSYICRDSLWIPQLLWHKYRVCGGYPTQKITCNYKNDCLCLTLKTHYISLFA